MDNDSTGGRPRRTPSRTAWGLTQVHSNAIASGTALLIDPMAGSGVRPAAADRVHDGQPRVELHSEHPHAAPRARARVSPCSTRTASSRSRSTARPDPSDGRTSRFRGTRSGGLCPATSLRRSPMGSRYGSNTDEDGCRQGSPSGVRNQSCSLSTSNADLSALTTRDAVRGRAVAGRRPRHEHHVQVRRDRGGIPDELVVRPVRHRRPALLAQTADQTSTAWAANTAKTVALATAQRISSSRRLLRGDHGQGDHLSRR
jgi:hypothetical protein